MGIKGSALSSWPGRGWALKGTAAQDIVPLRTESTQEMGRRNFQGKTMVRYNGFWVLTELLGRCSRQLTAISRLTPAQKQFVGTMIDTEIAAGYYIRRSNVSGDTWVAYIAVKMKYPGDLAYMARLVSHLPPSRGWYTNAIKGSRDRRWSLNLHGIVAYALLRETRPFLHNEKSIIEVDCILSHGPTVSGANSHPFITCGASRVRRGVWYWPRIDDDNSK